MSENKNLRRVGNFPTLPENFREEVNIRERTRVRQYQAKTATNPRYDSPATSPGQAQEAMRAALQTSLDGRDPRAGGNPHARDAARTRRESRREQRPEADQARRV